MRKSIAILLTSLLGLALLLGACGAKMDGMGLAPQERAANELALDFNYTASAVDEPEKAPAPSGEAVKNPLANRKIIKDLDASVDTREFDKYIAGVESKVAALGGYVESKQTGDGGYYYTDTRSATLVLRVPAEALDSFKGSLGERGKVTSLSETVRDITASYTDVEAHIKALKTERDALLKLMERADKLADLLQVQDRLTDVRYRLDSLESQMRQMDDQIAMSAVKLRVNEVERVAPDTPQGFFAKTWSNFKENLFSVGRGLRDFASGFLSSLPFLVVLAIPTALIIWLVVRRRRRKKGKK